MTSQRCKAPGTAVVAVFALIAFFAQSASAAPEWHIAGKKITTLELELSFKHLLLLNVPIFGTFHYVSGHAHKVIHPGGTGTGTILLKGGVLLGSKGEQLPCTVDDSTINFKDRLVEHGSEVYDVYEPTSGTTLTAIRLLGKLCPLPEENLLKGAFATLVNPTESIKQPMNPVNEATELLLESGLGITLGLTFNAKAEAATLTSEGQLELTGPNVGKVWGAK